MHEPHFLPPRIVAPLVLVSGVAAFSLNGQFVSQASADEPAKTVLCTRLGAWPSAAHIIMHNHLYTGNCCQS